MRAMRCTEREKRLNTFSVRWICLQICFAGWSPSMRERDFQDHAGREARKNTRDREGGFRMGIQDLGLVELAVVPVIVVLVGVVATQRPLTSPGTSRPWSNEAAV